MKKLLSVLVMLMFVCSIAYVCMADSLTTRMTSYKTLTTATSAEAGTNAALAAATGFGIGAPTGSVDLLYSGSDSYANAIVLIAKATGAANTDTATQYVYGVVDQGPPQLIASIVWTFGDARSDGATATSLWADTAVVTATHITTVTVADSAANRVVSVQFDATGYRYIYSLFTAQTGSPTLMTSLYRAY